MSLNDQVQKRIRNTTVALESGQFADVLLAALNTGNGLMQQRIFTRNLDVEGNSFGTYIGKPTMLKFQKSTKKFLKLTPYQVKRLSKGRQIVKKDLEFTGELRRAIETVIVDNKSAAIEFTNSRSAKIGRGQEVQITNIRFGQKGTTKGIGIPIFKLNPAEKEEVLRQARLLISQIMRKK